MCKGLETWNHCDNWSKPTKMQVFPQLDNWTWSLFTKYYCQWCFQLLHLSWHAQGYIRSICETSFHHINMHIDPLLIIDGHHFICTQSKKNRFLHNKNCLFQNNFMHAFYHSPFSTINPMFLHVFLHIPQHIEVPKVFKLCHWLTMI